MNSKLIEYEVVNREDLILSPSILPMVFLIGLIEPSHRRKFLESNTMVIKK